MSVTISLRLRQSSLNVGDNILALLEIKAFVKPLTKMCSGVFHKGHFYKDYKKCVSLSRYFVIVFYMARFSCKVVRTDLKLTRIHNLITLKS